MGLVPQADEYTGFSTMESSVIPRPFTSLHCFYFNFSCFFRGGFKLAFSHINISTTGYLCVDTEVDIYRKACGGVTVSRPSAAASPAGSRRGETC